jgi:hypothetical protein
VLERVFATRLMMPNRRRRCYQLRGLAFRCALNAHACSEYSLKRLIGCGLVFGCAVVALCQGGERENVGAGLKPGLPLPADTPLANVSYRPADGPDGDSLSGFMGFFVRPPVGLATSSCNSISGFSSIRRALHPHSTPPRRKRAVGAPGWRRCSSFKYYRYAQSSRLASGALRPPRCDAALAPRAAKYCVS